MRHLYTHSFLGHCHITFVDRLTKMIKTIKIVVHVYLSLAKVGTFQPQTTSFQALNETLNGIRKFDDSHNHAEQSQYTKSPTRLMFYWVIWTGDLKKLWEIAFTLHTISLEIRFYNHSIYSELTHLLTGSDFNEIQTISILNFLKLSRLPKMVLTGSSYN